MMKARFHFFRPACVALLIAHGAAAEEPAEPAPEAEAAAPAAEPVRSSGPSMDYLQLESSAIIGNRELPKVLYIVPWKSAEAGDLPERPVNSLLEEVLAPVDRDEFRRHVAYHSQLYAPDAASGSGRDPRSDTPAEE